MYLPFEYLIDIIFRESLYLVKPLICSSNAIMNFASMNFLCFTVTFEFDWLVLVSALIGERVTVLDNDEII